MGRHVLEGSSHCWHRSGLVDGESPAGHIGRWHLRSRGSCKGTPRLEAGDSRLDGKDRSWLLFVWGWFFLTYGSSAKE